MGVFGFSNPFVAWEAYRGALIPPDTLGYVDFQPLSLWGANHILSGVNEKTVSETMLELIRQERYPESISRLKGMYYFESREAALRASNGWQKNNHFKAFCLAEVDVDSSATFTRVDANWITHHLHRFDPQNLDWMDAYWQGVPYPGEPEPLWEILTDGRGVIAGTELRERAYENLRRLAPSSLGLLELSRVACWLYSDLGHQVPFVRRIDATTYELAYIVDFRDALNPEFLNRFGQNEGPKNTSDLNTQSELVTLNLLDRTRQFQINEAGPAFPLITDRDVINIYGSLPNLRDLLPDGA